MFCHSLILCIHLLRQNVLNYIYKNLPPKESFLVVHTMGAITVLIENILLPTYWFTSAWLNFEDLWSTRNTIFHRSKRLEKFQMIGNWKPQNLLHLYSKNGKCHLIFLSITYMLQTVLVIIPLPLARMKFTGVRKKIVKRMDTYFALFQSAFSSL